MKPSDPTEAPLDWYATILDSVADGVFTVDETFHITSFNRAAEQITGYGKAEAIGRPCNEVFRADICALRRSFRTGEPLVNIRVDVLNREGRQVPISVSTAILRGGGHDGGVATFRDLSTEGGLRELVRASGEPPGVIGMHPRLQRIHDILPDVAASDATVLIEGPSGSGKGLLASTIHGMSPRKDAAFVKVSCAALPENLLESELFGYRKGAFTDARRDKPGRIAAAQGGTLFLDEIGDVPLSVQVKLLRFLQDREYEPLGANQAVRADVRVIAATNRNLGQRIEEGRFREDLFYRLKVVHFELPPLAERKDDIPLLVDRFVSRQNQRTGRGLLGVSDDALRCLRAHDYPGNVRELENAIEHAFVMCHEGWIQRRHLPPWICSCPNVPEGPRAAMDPREVAQADVIRRTLERHGGNRAAAARELGMHRATLWRWLRKLGDAG
jgi:PAS domain S-box-containing protein